MFKFILYWKQHAGNHESEQWVAVHATERYRVSRKVERVVLTCRFDSCLEGLFWSISWLTHSLWPQPPRPPVTFHSNVAKLVNFNQPRGLHKLCKFDKISQITPVDRLECESSTVKWTVNGWNEQGLITAWKKHFPPQRRFSSKTNVSHSVIRHGTNKKTAPFHQHDTNTYNLNFVPNTSHQ